VQLLNGRQFDHWSVIASTAAKEKQQDRRWTYDEPNQRSSVFAEQCYDDSGAASHQLTAQLTDSRVYRRRRRPLRHGIVSVVDQGAGRKEQRNGGDGGGTREGRR